VPTAPLLLSMSKRRNFMAGEFTKIRVKAIAKLEKYPVGTTEEDIKLGKVKPEEVIQSEDILISPTEDVIRNLQQMGFKISPEIIEKVQ